MDNRKTKIFVFGAGASVHVGGPLTKHFLSEGLNLLSYEDEKFFSVESFRKVACLLDTLYGSQLLTQIENAIQIHLIEADLKIPATIEELLTFLEISISKGETWLPFNELRRVLIDFIFQTLDCLTLRYTGGIVQRNPDGTWNRKRNCYQNLIDYLIDINDINCFISFNYDLFLDNAVSINNYDLLGDYNLNFSSINDFPGYERILDGRRAPKDVDILKLHGSLNWGHCEKCKELHLAYFERYIAYKNKKCNSCGNQLTALLIPPTFRKNIVHGIESLWERANNLLMDADDITIIGYSFPEADIDAKWLFKNSVARNSKKPKLTLVEPNEQVREK